MSQDNLLDRIAIDPNICHGYPYIRGHQIWVSLILDYIAGGSTIEQIIEIYPELETEDILACLAYSTEANRCSSVERQLHMKHDVELSK